MVCVEIVECDQEILCVECVYGFCELFDVFCVLFEYFEYDVLWWYVELFQVCEQCGCLEWVGEYVWMDVEKQLFVFGVEQCEVFQMQCLCELVELQQFVLVCGFVEYVEW